MRKPSPPASSFIKGIPQNILIACAQTGSQKALTILVEAYTPLIISVSFKKSFSRFRSGMYGRRQVKMNLNSTAIRPEDIEDLKSHLFLEIIKRIKNFNGTRKFSSYINDSLEWAAINFWKRHLRHASRYVQMTIMKQPHSEEQGLVYESSEELNDVEDERAWKPCETMRNNVITDEVKEEIVRIASAFGEKILTFAVLYYIEGLTQRQIAEIFHYRSRETISIALKPVREALQQSEVAKEFLQ